VAGNLLKPGDIILVHLPNHAPPGHEQEGERPVIVVGVPPEPVRFPLILVAPLTTRIGPWAQKNPLLYPCLPAGVGGLHSPSIVLLDQVRALDLRRATHYIGTLDPASLEAIRRGLRAVLGL